MTNQDIKKNNFLSDTDKDNKEQMIPLSMMQNMMDEIKELKSKQKELEERSSKDEKEPETVPENIMRLLEYEEKLVVGMNDKRGVWKKYNKERREDELFTEVTLEDKEGKQIVKEINYMDLMQEGKIIECPVLDVKITPIEEKGRMINVREVKNYKTVITKGKVRQIVKSEERIVALSVPAPYNRKVAINIKYVNIK